ncbi:hypothetical protein ACSFA0_25175 [Variovorax sp. LT1P1]|uniref:hypothetical protein n=1 Tax=Variovorax sp. LT1P1 TaxID=3443730 RepID=UPI003F465E7E
MKKTAFLVAVGLLPLAALADGQTMACNLSSPERRSEICGSPRMAAKEADLAAAVKVAIGKGMTNEQVLEAIRRWVQVFEGPGRGLRSENDGDGMYKSMIYELQGAPKRLGLKPPPEPAKARTTTYAGDPANEEVFFKYHVGGAISWEAVLVALKKGFDEVQSATAPRDVLEKVHVPKVIGGLPKYLACGGNEWEKSSAFYEVASDGTMRTTQRSDDGKTWNSYTEKWKVIGGGKKPQTYLFSKTHAFLVEWASYEPPVKGKPTPVIFAYYHEATGDMQHQKRCLAAETMTPIPAAPYVPPPPRPSAEDQRVAQQVIGWIADMRTKGAKCSSVADFVQSRVRQFGVNSPHVTSAFDEASARGCF